MHTSVFASMTSKLQSWWHFIRHIWREGWGIHPLVPDLLVWFGDLAGKAGCTCACTYIAFIASIMGKKRPNIWYCNFKSPFFTRRRGRKKQLRNNCGAGSLEHQGKLSGSVATLCGNSMWEGTSRIVRAKNAVKSLRLLTNKQQSKSE